MSSDRNRKVEELFHSALELDPDQRSSFLEQACAGDPSLKKEVEAFLASHEKASVIPQKPAWDLITNESSLYGENTSDPDPNLPFDRLGEFRIIKRLGEGGMGVVYLAVQESLKREVALKTIRSDKISSYEAVKRFRREVQAITRLSHPNITTIYGSGEEKGHYYFAMELLPGKGLDEVLRESLARGIKIPTSQVLQWIKSIASALEAAHKLDIIHRDVKPSNIHITPDDKAMLMDFGVSRHLMLPTLTHTGDFRGTPHYASPEQVESKRKIDVKSDVYSLGVTLYEATTGRVPFAGETTKQVFHQILEKDPVLPRRLNPAISRDLETVILKTMEKEPHRRYQTMEEFYNDLECLMTGEMIKARPYGPVQRAWKRLRRNPVVSAAVGVTMITILTSLGYILFFSYPEMIKQRDYAQEQAEIAIAAEKKAKQKQELAVKALTDAEREANKAQSVLEFLKEMLSSADPGKVGRDVKVIDVLGKASEKIDRSYIHLQLETLASVHVTIGSCYLSLGLYEHAEKHIRKAIEINQNKLGEEHRDTLTSKRLLAAVERNQGKLLDSESRYKKVLISCIKVFGQSDKDTIQTIQEYSLVLMDQESHEKLSKAISLLTDVLDAKGYDLNIPRAEDLLKLEYINEILRSEDSPIKAAKYILDATTVYSRNLGETEPDVLETLYLLAVAVKKDGDYDRADKLLQIVIHNQQGFLRKDHPGTLRSKSLQAEVFMKQEKYDDSEDLLKKCIAAQTRELGEEHPDTLLSIRRLGELHARLGNYADADTLLRKSLRMQSRLLIENHPDTMYTMNCLAELLAGQEKYGDAETMYRKIIVLSLHRYGEQHPITTNSMKRLATVLTHQGKGDQAAKLNDQIENIQ